jgi:DNA-binding transcriptional LysR family regulator
MVAPLSFKSASLVPTSDSMLGKSQSMGVPWSLRHLDLVSLRLFAAAVEEGTLAKTATREHVTISAISRRISELEARCGLTLLERYDRGVRPTAAGQRLVNHIRSLKHLLERMVIDMESIRSGYSGDIVVHAHMSATSGALPEKLAEFIADNPQVHIVVDEHTSLEVLRSVRAGTADIGFVSGTAQSTDLHFIPWLHDELVVVLPAAHPLVSREELTLSELLDEPFVGMQRDSALLTLYRHHASALGRVLQERVHATSFESVRKMVSLRLGVAILPAVAAYPYATSLNIAVRPLRESWAKRPLTLCVRDPQLVSAPTQRLIDHLTKDPASRPIP